MSGRRTINFIDLFAGAGGLSRGFAQASSADVEFKSVFAVEIDRSSAASYEANFGHPVFTKPIERLKRTDIPLSTRVDLIIGGPPCQGFSPLGKMTGSEEHGAMNKLWKYYFRVVRWFRPKVFVIENVPEFLKSAEYQEVERTAHFLDYKLTSGVLKAVHFGVPQQRKRGFIIGVRNGVAQLPMGSLNIPRTVRNAIEDLKNKPLVFDLPLNGSTQGIPRFRVSQLHIGRNPTRISLERYRCVPQGGNRFDLMSLRPDITPICWLNKPKGSTDVFGRLAWDEPSLTIRTEFFKPEKGCYLHPEFDRPITHWEAARLQTFPDSYYFCGSKIDIARQIGNAVPPKLGEALANAVKPFLR
jgi:DNA (cytosine-5)-methyltransferase 1